MPSTKSKQTAIRSSQLSVARICSEKELISLAQELSEEIQNLPNAHARPRLLLVGPMGAGKSTFARALLEALGVERAAEGSPTFAIAHEYRSLDEMRAIHADGYRLKSEQELEETGLLEPLWDENTLVIFEWMDLFPETHKALQRSDLPLIEIRIGFDSDELNRKVEFVRTGFKR